MYEKPVLKRLGKLRKITKTIFALEPVPDGWIKELPEAEPPARRQTVRDHISAPVGSVPPASDREPVVSTERVRESA